MESFKKFFKAVNDKIQYNPKQLRMGDEVEHEHTDIDEVADTIAKQHLEEDPEYYDKLKKMESLPKKKPTPIDKSKHISK